MADRRWWIKIQDNFVVDFIDDTCVNFGKSVSRSSLQGAGYFASDWSILGQV